MRQQLVQQQEPMRQQLVQLQVLVLRLGLLFCRKRTKQQRR
jgi:hypothetical protein